MKGYGVSVFKGTKLERFDVEVLSVLKNFNPKYDVVLITCKGANLEHTGAIAGTIYMAAAGVYHVRVFASDGLNSSFVDFDWTITGLAS